MSPRPDAVPTESPRRAPDLRWIAAVVVLLAVGLYLRASPSLVAYPGPGYDETLYVRYVDHLDEAGTASLARTWLEAQPRLPDKVVPPLRLAPLLAATLWKRLSGSTAFEALRAVSCLASMLTLVIAVIFARRIGGKGTALAVLALMCVAPLQVAMAHRALVEGPFSCAVLLVLWLFWECLHAADRRWAVALGGATGLMLLTKETGVFVVATLAVVLGTDRWLRIGETSRAAWAALGGGLLTCVAVFTVAFGGLSPLVDIARVDMFKPMSPWSIEYADGPWYHILLGMFLVSPLVVPLALGAVTSLRWRDERDLLMIAFTALTYGCLESLRYHAVIRYAAMWDFPVAWLAWSQVRVVTADLRPRDAVRAAVLAALCASQLLWFHRFFVDNPLYEPLTRHMLRIVGILK